MEQGLNSKNCWPDSLTRYMLFDFVESHLDGIRALSPNNPSRTTQPTTQDGSSLVVPIPSLG
jgi:hypothetical protein